MKRNNLELNSNSAKLSNVENSDQLNIETNSNQQSSNEKHLSKLIFTPNNPPWGSWSALGVWFASILFIILIPNIVVLPYLAKQKIDLSNTASIAEFAQTDPTAIFLQLISVIPAHFFTILLGWLVITNFRKYSFTEMLGWKWNGFKLWHSILIFVIFYLVALILINIFGDVENDFERMLKNSRSAVYLVAFFATFTAPLVEEMVYRGLLYSAFQRKFGVSIAVVLITLLFTAIHVPQYSLNQVPDYASVISILFLSLTLTLIRVKTGNLLPCIMLHTVFNGIQSVLMIAEPYLRQYFANNSAQTTFFFWS